MSLLVVCFWEGGRAEMEVEEAREILFDPFFFAILLALLQSF